MLSKRRNSLVGDKFDIAELNASQQRTVVGYRKYSFIRDMPTPTEVESLQFRGGLGKGSDGPIRDR